MKVGLVVNDVATEEAGYTTTRLGMTALNMGHEAWLMGVGDLATDPDDSVRAWARSAPRKSYRSTKTYLAEVQGEKARVERIGNTSVTVHVEVLAERNPADPQVVKVTEANLTYVAIDTQGRPRPSRAEIPVGRWRRKGMPADRKVLATRSVVLNSRPPSSGY